MKYRAILADIVLRTALHVGTGEEDESTDALCRRDSEGRWLIPGTALGGAIRSLATRLAPRMFGVEGVCRGLLEDADKKPSDPCNCVVCKDLGFRYLGADESTDKNRPWTSRLWIYDSVALPNDLHTRIRDGVGIDRTTGAAARRGAAKFDLEVVPAGTRFPLRLELTDDDETTLLEQLLAIVLSEWVRGRGVLGGRSARGAGAFDLRNVRLVSRDMSSDVGLLGFLSSDQPWKGSDDGMPADTRWIIRQMREVRRSSSTASELPSHAARSFFAVGFRLEFDGPMVINDGAAASLSGFEFAPRIEQLEQGSRLVLPGSSLRGVLRSQAERIARTVASFRARDAPPEKERRTHFLEHCPACDPLQNDEPDGALASCASLLKKQAGINDAFDPLDVSAESYCPACQLFGSSFFGSRLRIEDSFAAREQSVMHGQDFLAIDRFTGGGLEHAKFDAIGAWKPTFEARLLLDNPQPWEIAWITLVLRDLRDGLVRVGFGGAKGFGRVGFRDARIQLGYVDDKDLCSSLGVAKLPELIDDAARRRSGLFHVLGGDWDQWVHVVDVCDLVGQWREMLAGVQRT